MTPSSLHELSDALGILPEYVDQEGVTRRASDESRRAAIAAMGIDASTDSCAAEALRALRSWEQDRLLEPVHVVAYRADGSVPLALGGGRRELSGRWELTIEGENGDRWSSEGRGGTPTVGRSLAPGYYSVSLRLADGEAERDATQRLIVAPPSCVSADDLLEGRRGFGLTANLYTVRSDRNWGVGDLTDLGDIAMWAASVDAAFVGINPLHALRNRGHDVSPYSPISRLFRNPIYVDIEAASADAADPVVIAALGTPELRSRLDDLRERHHVGYEQVMAAKGMALDHLHRAFERRIAAGAPIGREYEAYVAAQDPDLTRFATYLAIAESGGHPAGRSASRGDCFDWRQWDPALHHPDGRAVARFREEHAERVDHHRWVQFELDRQLGVAAARGREAGLGIGLYQDLAVGSAAGGADHWMYRELFLDGASVGAPPDPYAAQGQNWGLPPIDPRALRESGYEYFIRLLRANLRHAGGLRIDHAMGLFRLFWIPNGLPGAEGVYVRYPASELLGIIALESHRHRALIVGEDLGTVGDEVPPALERWGILSSKVMFFERDGIGFRPPESYPRRALATATTHDMIPLAGFESGRDVALRSAMGLLDRPIDDARADREQELDALSAMLRDGTSRAPRRSRYTGVELRGAVHEMICRTPSVLAGISLDDLAGETEPVNIPGVGAEQHRSWTRRMRRSLVELTHSDTTRALIPCPDRVPR